MIDFSELTVEEYTSPCLITISYQADLDTAMEVMQENQIRHLPVVKNEKVIGIISERDVLTHVGKDWSTMLKVADIMNPSILSVHTQDNLGEVAYQLSAEKKGSAIVLNSDDELFGIFTTTDALNALVEIVYPPAKTMF